MKDSEAQAGPRAFEVSWKFAILSYQDFWSQHALLSREEVSDFLRTLLIVRIAANQYVTYGSWEDYSHHYRSVIRPQLLATCEQLRELLSHFGPRGERKVGASWLYRLVPLCLARVVPKTLRLAYPMRWPVTTLSCLVQFDAYMDLEESVYDSSSKVTALRLVMNLLCDEIMGAAFWVWSLPDPSDGYWRLTVDPVDKFGLGD